MNPWDGIPAPQNKQDVNSILFSDVEFPDGVSIEWIKLHDSSVGISVFFQRVSRRSNHSSVVQSLGRRFSTSCKEKQDLRSDSPSR